MQSGLFCPYTCVVALAYERGETLKKRKLGKQHFQNEWLEINVKRVKKNNKTTMIAKKKDSWLQMNKVVWLFIRIAIEICVGGQIWTIFIMASLQIKNYERIMLECPAFSGLNLGHEKIQRLYNVLSALHMYGLIEKLNNSVLDWVDVIDEYHYSPYYFAFRPQEGPESVEENPFERKTYGSVWFRRTLYSISIVFGSYIQEKTYLNKNNYYWTFTMCQTLF